MLLLMSLVVDENDTETMIVDDDGSDGRNEDGCHHERGRCVAD